MSPQPSLPWTPSSSQICGRRAGHSGSADVLIKTHRWSRDWDPGTAEHILLTHRHLSGVLSSYQRLGWAFHLPASYVAEHQLWKVGIKLRMVRLDQYPARMCHFNVSQMLLPQMLQLPLRYGCAHAANDCCWMSLLQCAKLVEARHEFQGTVRLLCCFTWALVDLGASKCSHFQDQIALAAWWPCAMPDLSGEVRNSLRCSQAYDDCTSMC